MRSVTTLRHLLAGILLLCYAGAGGQIRPGPNILFIAIDDLKPLLGAYGDKLAHTPAMDAIAAEGTVFFNNHCQQAVCGPSRASLLTGLRPDHTKVWDLETVPRKANPSIVSIPQFFRQQGYETVAYGKIFHLPSSGPGHDSLSWSIPYKPTTKPEYFSAAEKPATENLNVPDSVYQDGEIARSAINYLQQYDPKNSGPFFLAVGFRKPHLPFVAPQKYWNLFDRSRFSTASFTEHAKGAPAMAYTNCGELRRYTDIPDSGNIPLSKQLELIHGYYAATAFVDAQISELIQQLKQKGLYDNTIIVLWGDHGWHLGDHGQWTKHTNYEQATRSPLIIRAPGYAKSSVRHSPTEFIDLFPTLCDLAGMSSPSGLDGLSLVPLMKDPDLMIKPFAISQYPRGSNMKYMGYALRNTRYRLVVWAGGNFTTDKPFLPSDVTAIELYDYEKDPQETTNVALDPSYKEVKEELMKEITGFFQTEYNKKH